MRSVPWSHQGFHCQIQAFIPLLLLDHGVGGNNRLAQIHRSRCKFAVCYLVVAEQESVLERTIGVAFFLDHLERHVMVLLLGVFITVSSIVIVRSNNTITIAGAYLISVQVGRVV